MGWSVRAPFTIWLDHTGYDLTDCNNICFNLKVKSNLVAYVKTLNKQAGWWLVCENIMEIIKSLLLLLSLSFTKKSKPLIIKYSGLFIIFVASIVWYELFSDALLFLRNYQKGK